LKNAPLKFKNVVVAHNMTVKERKECKHFVDEAKQKADLDTSGEFLYWVRGHPGNMKIIKIENEARQSQYFMNKHRWTDQQEAGNYSSN